MCGFLRFRLSEFELLPVQVAAFHFSYVVSVLSRLILINFGIRRLSFFCEVRYEREKTPNRASDKIQARIC